MHILQLAADCLLASATARIYADSNQPLRTGWNGVPACLDESIFDQSGRGDVDLVLMRTFPLFFARTLPFSMR